LEGLPSFHSLEKMRHCESLLSLAVEGGDDHPVVLLDQNGGKNVMERSGHPGSGRDSVTQECCLGIRVAVPGPERADPFALAINMNEPNVTIANGPSII
jgi:hypothetical protein